MNAVAKKSERKLMMMVEFVILHKKRCVDRNLR